MSEVKKASLQKLLKLVIQGGFIKPMTRLLLTLLISFVPQLYGAKMTSTQRVSAATLL